MSTNLNVLKFQKAHQIGDIVKGKIIDYQDGQALVKINDLILSAQVGQNYPPGETLKFKILTLTPQIILQAIDNNRFETVV
ncbi:MAG: hypothetical protein Q9M37_09045 [Desulfonauticus sp.]|nr:hypothetical protein [Desulfonauticus sp.]